MGLSGYSDSYVGLRLSDASAFCDQQAFVTRRHVIFPPHQHSSACNLPIPVCAALQNIPTNSFLELIRSLFFPILVTDRLLGKYENPSASAIRHQQTADISLQSQPAALQKRKTAKWDRLAYSFAL